MISTTEPSFARRQIELLLIEYSPRVRRWLAPFTSPLRHPAASNSYWLTAVSVRRTETSGQTAARDRSAASWPACHRALWDQCKCLLSRRRSSSDQEFATSDSRTACL